MDIIEAGCLGSMILAGIGTKRFTLNEAMEKFVKVKDVFEPDDKIRERYLEKYYKYKQLYSLVSQLY